MLGGSPHVRPISAQPTQRPFGPRYPGPPRQPQPLHACASASGHKATVSTAIKKANLPKTRIALPHRARECRFGCVKAKAALSPSPRPRAPACRPTVSRARLIGSVSKIARSAPSRASLAFAIRSDPDMLAEFRKGRAPNHSNCGMRKSLCAIFSWHFSSAAPSLQRLPRTTARDQTPAITMFRATQPAAEPTSRRIIRQTRTAIRATITALKAISTPTTGRQAGATEKPCGWRVVRATCFLAPWPARQTIPPRRMAHCAGVKPASGMEPGATGNVIDLIALALEFWRRISRTGEILRDGTLPSRLTISRDDRPTRLRRRCTPACHLSDIYFPQ